MLYRKGDEEQEETIPSHPHVSSGEASHLWVVLVWKENNSLQTVRSKQA